MKLSQLLILAVTTLGVSIAGQGCSLFGGNDATNDETLCTPGALVFCRCADRAPGTKLCKADGRSFELCMTSDSGECVGGEVDDPDTNKPIPSDREPYPGEKPEPDNAVDVCPGKSTAIATNRDVTLEGDTTGAVNDRKGKQGACAVGAGGKDHVYRLIPSGSGSLEVKVQGSEALDPVVYIRTTCDDEASQSSCGPQGKAKLAQLKLNVTVGKEYFLFIDGASSSVGKYKATIRLTTGSFCGDGKVDPDEACDDGNKTEGDGCSNDCKKVDGNPATGGECPGHPVDLWQGLQVTGAGSTTSYGNAWNAPDQTCNFGGTNTFQDHVYEITPHATGSITVTVTPTVSTNFMLTARRTCTDATTATSNMCKNDVGNSTSAETMTFTATSGQKAFIAVEGGGHLNPTGDYTISFKLQ